MQRRQRRGRAFTLIELLVVIVIIMVLIGILMPALYGTKKQAKQNQARAEIKALEAAIVNYKFANREWPYSGSHNRDYSNQNSRVVTELLGEDPPLIDESNFRMNGDVVLDPWGDPYRIRLDTDYDGYWNGTTNQFLRGVEVTSENL